MAPATKRSLCLVPPLFFLAAIIAMVVLYWLLPVGQFLSGSWRLAGALPAMLGLVVAIVAAQQFKRAHTTVKPLGESSALVATGMFRLSRNPMYLGLDLVLLGLGLGLGSVVPFVVVPAFHWLVTVLIIVPEEKALAGRFGDAYEAYRRRVRRWL